MLFCNECFSWQNPMFPIKETNVSAMRNIKLCSRKYKKEYLLFLFETKRFQLLRRNNLSKIPQKNF